MSETKQWKRVSENNYQFWVNDAIAAEIIFKPNTLSNEAMVKIGDETYLISRKGFWKSNIEITDMRDTVVMEVLPEKWYSSAWSIKWEGKQYSLKIHNNPLAEYMLEENGQPVLAYGIKTKDGQGVTQITSSKPLNGVLPDCLMWYLFLPIAMSNTLDENLMTFLTSLA